MLQIEATLRDKNQVTILREVAERHKLQPGQKLVIVDDSNQPGQFVVRVIPRTYAGLLAGVFGTAEENVAYVRRERDDWS
jgi:bifunctional DNA-binding transcriptional regulator/antitoxin component of YhaV-PrlF toxin-antitoxin module